MAFTSSCRSASMLIMQSQRSTASDMPAHSAFMWPTLCASFTPSNRASDSCRPAITRQVSSLLPSSTSTMRLSGSMIFRAIMSSVSSVSLAAVIGRASCSL